MHVGCTQRGKVKVNTTAEQLNRGKGFICCRRRGKAWEQCRRTGWTASSEHGIFQTTESARWWHWTARNGLLELHQDAGVCLTPAQSPVWCGKSQNNKVALLLPALRLRRCLQPGSRRLLCRLCPAFSPTLPPDRGGPSLSGLSLVTPHFTGESVFLVLHDVVAEVEK